jgi:hypothetical protein
MKSRRFLVVLALVLVATGSNAELWPTKRNRKPAKPEWVEMQLGRSRLDPSQVAARLARIEEESVKTKSPLADVTYEQLIRINLFDPDTDCAQDRISQREQLCKALDNRDPRQDSQVIEEKVWPGVTITIYSRSMSRKNLVRYCNAGLARVRQSCGGAADLGGVFRNKS